MSGESTDSERMGRWLADNPHHVETVARCQRGDGRVLAKVCEVEGLRWRWLVGTRSTRGAVVDEILELADDIRSLNDGEARSARLREIVDGLPPSGYIQMPVAWPADDKHYVNLVNCPSCHRRYSIDYDDGRLAATLLPPGDPLLYHR